MARARCVKGSVFGGAVEQVNKLIGEGAISREEVTRRLPPGDLRLLDSSILIASWYDVGTFTRLNELLRDVEGGGSHEYLRELGRESARRLLDGGLYSQLEYLQRMQLGRVADAQERFEAFSRDLRRLNTISSSIYNFGRWEVETNPGHPRRYAIVVSDAEGLSDVLCWRIEGFVNEMAAVHGSRDLWSWRRVGRDVVRIDMTRDL